MGMPFFDNVNYSGKKPLDSRAGYDTVANMVAATKVYDGLMAYVTATKKYYTYDSTNEADPTLGKWREFQGGGGGASTLEELSDVTFGLLSDGDILQYDQTNDEWVNGQLPTVPVDISDLNDVETSSPTDGQYLRWNNSQSRWENGDIEDTIIHGFAAEVEVESIADFIDKVNTLTPFTQITYSSSVFSGKTANALAIFVAPSSIELIFSEYPFDFSALPVKQSGYYRCSVSKKSADSSTHPCYTSPTNFSYTNGITSLNSETLQTDYTHDRVILDADIVGRWYVTSNVGFNRYGTGTYIQNTSIVDGLFFYEDQAHTTLITPEKGKIYVDYETGDSYSWNGFSYDAVGGGGGGSYTAGNGITITNNVIATDNMQSGDMADVVTPLPSPSGGGEVLTATLASGSTSVTFTGIPTSGNNLINFYTSTGINYTAINTATSGQVTLTFESQSSAVTVYCEIRSLS